MYNQNENPLWANLSFRLVLNTASHPFEYAKVLIQVGHEPLPPFPTKTLFGKPAYGLPNVFQYVKYIKTVDGLSGCFRGIAPRLISNSINVISYKTATDAAYNLSSASCKYIKKKEDEYTETDRWEKLIHETMIEISGKIVAVITSQPFHVITVRVMAQFVGGENKYNGIFSSFGEIYRNDGIFGFFRGLLPRLIAEVLATVIVNLCVYMTKKILKDQELLKITSIPIALSASAAAYPFQVVTTCMAVNNCGLAAGNPPQMPIYNNWTECWHHLSRTEQLHRGSSLLFRYYNKPHASSFHHNLQLKY